MRALPLLVLGLATALSGPGCGEEDEFRGAPDPATERNDRPAKPPPGWRTLANRQAGFTISVPRGWTVRTQGTATLIRSRDRLLAVTVAADRSESGRTMRPRAYARRAFRAIPGFRRLRAQRVRRVGDSPYPNARVDGRGTLAGRRQRQHISVTAFRRARRVTYSVVAFGANARRRTPHAGPLATMLASLRGRRPAF